MRNAILFDLDGTLLDTAYDLTMALNEAIQRYQPKKHFSIEEARGIVGYGSESIFTHLVKEYVPQISYETFRDAFREIYLRRKHQGTTFFEGVTELLAHINTKKIPWGIVTNKTEEGAEQSAEKFPLLNTARCIVGCNTTSDAKPSPLPLLYACEKINMPPKDCWFVGDTIIDMQAAHAANIAALAVGYGYGTEDIKQGKYPPFAWIQSPLDILSYLP